MSRKSSFDEWESFYKSFPESHILQSPLWGELKSSFGWNIARVITGECGAQILTRQIVPGVSFAYIPKGPIIGDNSNNNLYIKNGEHSELYFWKAMDEICRTRRVAFLKVEPDNSLPDPQLPSDLTRMFIQSKHSIQPMRTIILDSLDNQERLLSRMKQKTRYNIRLAQKKGVRVEVSNDFSKFHELMISTGNRDKFGIHSIEYYKKAYNLFHPSGDCELLMAYYLEQPLAGLMVFKHGKKAWYFYGASAETLREYMSTYLIQWEAIQWAYLHGCTMYDFWGVPDFDANTLEQEFDKRSDGLWGVYRFKRGFGGKVIRSSGPYDRVYNPILYKFYQFWVSRKSVE